MLHNNALEQNKTGIAFSNDDPVQPHSLTTVSVLKCTNSWCLALDAFSKYDMNEYSRLIDHASSLACQSCQALQ